jgi:hypothetical protein
MADPRALLQTPRPDLRIERSGKVYVRTLGKICPRCHQIFYVYQVEGQEEEPYREDPEIELNEWGFPVRDVGSRDTCGHPDCHEWEDGHQFRRRVAARAEHGRRSRPEPSPEAAPAPPKRI